MKAQLLFISIFLSFSLNVFSQTESTQKSPKIEFKSKVCDLGEIEEGEYGRGEFVFYNRGNAPLVINSAKYSCGCMVADYPRAPIWPGDSNIIKAVFNSRGYGGMNIHKSITVYTNVKVDGKDEVIVLYVKGYVRKKLEIDPNAIIFKDTVNNFLFDSLENNLVNVEVGTYSRMVKYFKYIGNDTVIIQRTWTCDPHYICEWPREPLIPNRVYPYTVCFCHKGYRPNSKFSKSMGFDFSDGTKAILVFRIFYADEGIGNK